MVTAGSCKTIFMQMPLIVNLSVPAASAALTCFLVCTLGTEFSVRYKQNTA